MRKYSFLILIFAIILTLYGCNTVKENVRIEVVEESIPSSAYIDDFELSDIKVRVYNSNDKYTEVELNSTMLSNDSLQTLQTVGTHTIDIEYLKLSTTFTITLVERSEYRISFETNGGSQINDITVREGNVIQLPNEPTKEDYTFGGWYLDENFNSPLMPNTIATRDLIIYAKWNFEFSSNDDNVLNVGSYSFYDINNPFFEESYFNKDIVNLTSLTLLTTDRDGGIVYNSIEGETITRGGVDYFYQGWTDISVNYDFNSATTSYRVKIKYDVKFSDGHVVDADDIIFSYYVYLDPNYTGSYPLNTLDIVGYREYLNNSSYSGLDGIVDSFIEAIGDTTNPNNNPTLDQYVLSEIRSLLSSELQWVKDDVITNDAYSGYWILENGDAYDPNYNSVSEVSPAATLASFYSLLSLGSIDNQNTYSVVGKSEETVIEEIALQYGYDFNKLDSNYGSLVISPRIRDKALELAIESSESTQEVDYISGIKKISQTEVEIKVKGFNSSDVYDIFGITVSPLHYYGDPALYDYNNHRFGFNNRSQNSMEIIQEKNDLPLGAGAYEFTKIEDDIIYLNANKFYYKGEPKIEYINLCHYFANDSVLAIRDGHLDISTIYGSKIVLDNIEDDNNSLDKVYEQLYDNEGYSYFGINAKNVKVGSANEIGSVESKALRKAFATVLASNRLSLLSDYYGDGAKVIDYPWSSSSWITPKVGDSNYQYAFVKDPNGNNIYGGNPINLSSIQRSERAKEAARLWLIEAGYAFVEREGEAQYGGKLWTATAPDGAKLSYEILILTGSTGDHPAYAIITEFKSIMAELGIEINIIDPSNTNLFWEKINNLSQEIWVASLHTPVDPDMYKLYHSSSTLDSSSDGLKSNYFYIKDSRLDQLISYASQSYDQNYRKTQYQKALDIVMDWGVVIPYYQRQNLVLYSNERIKTNTITQEVTSYWSWTNDIEKLELNMIQ